jgi:hypothetical protein
MTDQNESCAIHLWNRLEGRPSDPDAIRRLILAGGEVGRFHDPARPYLHSEDAEIALDTNRYDLAVTVEFEKMRPHSPSRPHGVERQGEVPVVRCDADVSYQRMPPAL